MYLEQFKLTELPFRLSPDPQFLYLSKHHARAKAYMESTIWFTDGFVVITGEIGAGKTTLVRTLLDGLSAEQIVAAQIVNTQLDSGDLLRAICTAYGIAAQGNSKAQLLATLEAFFTALAASGKRALLVIDEAQNLGTSEVEELRMLSNFQLGSHALLQSFLVGQPELRKMLQSPSMEQLRQRVIASCHLGPLNPDETRAYIEHRLQRVGWNGMPRFDADAFDEIHAFTDGIPRRINLLCSRLLLATFLAPKKCVEKRDVIETAIEMLEEHGDASVAKADWPSVRSAQLPIPRP